MLACAVMPRNRAATGFTVMELLVRSVSVLNASPEAVFPVALRLMRMLPGLVGTTVPR